MSDEKTFTDLAAWDWVIIGGRGSVLHHLDCFDDLTQATEDWGGPGATSCGRHAAWLSIPGLFTRMGANRCRRCCTKMGFPQGIGSPKNDETCREIVEAELASRGGGT